MVNKLCYRSVFDMELDLFKATFFRLVALHPNVYKKGVLVSLIIFKALGNKLNTVKEVLKKLHLLPGELFIAKTRNPSFTYNLVRKAIPFLLSSNKKTTGK